MTVIKQNTKRTETASKIANWGLLSPLLLGHLFTVVIGVVGLSGCSPSDTPTAADTPSSGAAAEADSPAIRLPSIRLADRAVVPVASLVAELENETVAVSGTVAEKAAVLDGWLYQLQDESGAVWVLSRDSDPTVGASATVEGVVRYEEIVVEGLDAGEVYLEERSYQTRER